MLAPACEKQRLPVVPGASPHPMLAASVPALLPPLLLSGMLQVGAFGRAYVRKSLTTAAPGGADAAAAPAETASVWRFATATQLGLPQGAEKKDALKKLKTADGDYTLAYANLCLIHGCARAMHPGGVVCARAKNKLAHAAASKKELADKRTAKAKKAAEVASSSGAK